MSYPPEHPEVVAPVHFRNHTALLLCTALPYLQPQYRHPVELALKFLEFTETLRLYQEFHMHPGAPSPKQPPEAGLFGLINTFVFDLEGLLTGLSKVCTGDEREIVGMFLNLIRAKNFYDTYGDLLQSQFSDLGSLNNLGNLFSGFSAEQTATPPSGILNNEQQETLDLLKSLFADELK